MHSQTTQHRIQQSIRTPTLPSSVARVNALLADPGTGIPELGAAIAEDPALAAMVLKVANSSYYGLREPVLAVERAAAVLGMRELHNIVLRVAVVQQYEHLSDAGGFDVEALWRHSILAGHMARSISRKARVSLPLTPEELYTCGLLHDLGKVVLFDNYRERYAVVARRASQCDASLCSLEREMFGFDHAQVGGVVAFMWGLPGEIEAAIDHHHGPAGRIDIDPIVSIVSFADVLANEVQEESGSDEALLRHSARRLLGLTHEDVDVLCGLGRERLPQIVI